MRLIVGRHGQTEWILDGRYTGTTGIPLTANGRRQALSPLPLLDHVLEGQRPLVVSSPRQRATDTASVALPDRDLMLDPLLAEYDYGDYGDYEGMTSTQMRRRAPGGNIRRDGCPQSRSNAVRDRARHQPHRYTLGNRRRCSMTQNHNSTNHNSTLHILGDRGQTVDGSANDVRGRQVKDKNGDGIGKVTDLLVDDRENRVRFLLVAHGGFLGFGDTKSLIPVDAVTKITEFDVHVDQSREQVQAAPGYTPDLVDDHRHHNSIYSHYGYLPYWDEGYMHPGGLGTSSVSGPLIQR